MRFPLVLAVATLAPSASASLLGRQSGLPGCALACLSSADFGSCQPTDNACLCRSDSFVQSSTLCIGKSCQGNDLQTALDAAKQLCAVVGVTLTSTPSGFPTGAGSATAPAASTTGSAAGSGSGSGSGSAAGSTPSPSATSASSSNSGNGASINGVNKVAGIAALGLVALVL